MLPGRPLGNVTFKMYGTISMWQAITFLSDFKLGHYMKIPPKSMFVVQVSAGYVVSLLLNLVKKKMKKLVVLIIKYWICVRFMNQ